MNVLPTRGMAATNATARMGNMLLKSGATMGAIAGFYDAAQAGVAVRRAWNRGDSSAARFYTASSLFSLFEGALA
nr:hypothetical protein [Pseudomonas sp. BIGb0427]